MLNNVVLSKFIVSSNISRILGSESVSTPSVAIIELVKNSYDADAKEVNLTFKNDSLVIQDDGHGMNLNDIQNKWLQIATAYKKRKQKSPEGRRYLGSKGVGRFATEFLGRNLTVFTKMESFPKYEFEINWDLFQFNDKLEEELLINEIDIKINETESDERNGTKLVLDSLSDDFDEKFLKNLRYELGMLIVPGFDKQFVIYINSPYEDLNGEVPTSIFDISNIKFEASITNKKNNTKIQGVFETQDGYKKIISTNINYNLDVGEFKFNLYLIDLYRKRNLPGSLLTKAKDMRKLMDVYGGLKIYLDGFRLQSYGDRRNDWLNLSELRIKRFGTLIPSNNQFFGYISLTSANNPNIIMTSNREKLIENEGYNNLKAISKAIFNVLANERVIYREYSLKKEEEIALESIPEGLTTENIDLLKSTKALFFQIEKIVSKERIPQASKKMILDTSKKIKNIITIYDKRKENTSVLLNQIATVGLSIVSIMHEIPTPLRNVIINENILKDMNYEMRMERLMLRAVNRIIQQSKRGFGYLSHLATLGSEEDYLQRKTVSLIDHLNELIQNYDGIIELNRINIKIESTIDKSRFYISFIPAYIESIFVNLLTNSIYFIKEKNVEGKISIVLKETGSGVNMYFSDNGIGIPNSISNEIFKPRFTTKRKDAENNLSGFGIGLYLVEQILKENNGKITVVQKKEINDNSKQYILSGATFLIDFPK